MNKYNKGLLAAMVLAAMSLMAAEDKTIQVTTFADEDGENNSACSLREAIKTAKLDRSYGGCNVGRVLAKDGTAPDVIQLQEGEYKLDRELVIESAVNIFGADPLNYSVKSPINNLYPTREALKTTINAQGKHRIFNSMASQAALNVTFLKLDNAYTSGDGAAFYVAGPVTLTTSEISNAKADGDGAAFYSVALDFEKNLVIQDSHIHHNIAKQHGSVVAMECSGNLGTTQTKLDILSSSIVNNGSTQSASLFDLCGNNQTAISNSTIAKNITSANGYILPFLNRENRPLSPSASLILMSNTIVENQAKSVLYYGNRHSGINLSYNVLAYNSGLSCEYAYNNGVPTKEELILLSSVKNGIQNTGAGRCVLPERTDSSQASDIDLSNVSMNSVLYPYLEPNITTRYLGLYYPRNNQTENDLVDIGVSGCTEVDQRGISRLAAATLLLDPTNKNSCEVGSVEIRRFTAVDINDLKNTSLVDLLKFYQDNIDDLKTLIEHKDTPSEDLPGLKTELKEYEDLKLYTEQHKKYRAIYVDPFALAMPAENYENSSIKLRLLNPDNYDVIVSKIGVGVLEGEGANLTLKGTVDEALKCEWKPDLKRIMMYRTDGKRTSATDFEYCKYELKDKASSATSAGILEARFENIAPIAKDDHYTIRPESQLIVTGNPLENDSDDGDGPLSTAQVNRTTFYHNQDGLETPIRIERIPAGVTIEAERKGPCPGDFQRQTCYGGKIQFAVKNNLSQFDYEMKYSIFDGEEKESGQATIYLNNTARNTNTSSGGGGAFGLWGVIALGAIAAYRSRRKISKS